MNRIKKWAWKEEHKFYRKMLVLSQVHKIKLIALLVLSAKPHTATENCPGSHREPRRTLRAKDKRNKIQH